MQVNRLVARTFQQFCLCCAHAPKDIRWLWDSPRIMAFWSICLKKFIIHWGWSRGFCGTVDLGEEEFGFTTQRGTLIWVEKLPEILQPEAKAVRVCSQQMSVCSPANEAADKEVDPPKAPVASQVFQDLLCFFQTQERVENDHETQTLKCLIQHLWKDTNKCRRLNADVLYKSAL